jgi:hypothetical protein
MVWSESFIFGEFVHEAEEVFDEVRPHLSLIRPSATFSRGEGKWTKVFFASSGLRPPSPKEKGNGVKFFLEDVPFYNTELRM